MESPLALWYQWERMLFPVGKSSGGSAGPEPRARSSARIGGNRRTGPEMRGVRG